MAASSVKTCSGRCSANEAERGEIHIHVVSFLCPAMAHALHRIQLDLSVAAFSKSSKF